MEFAFGRAVTIEPGKYCVNVPVVNSSFEVTVNQQVSDKNDVGNMAAFATVGGRVVRCTSHDSLLSCHLRTGNDATCNDDANGDATCYLDKAPGSETEKPPNSDRTLSL